MLGATPEVAVHQNCYNKNSWFVKKWILSRLSFLLCLLSLCLLSFSAKAQFTDHINIEYQRFVLDNGLTLLVHEDRKAPIVAVNVWYHVGSKNEHPGITGFAHLFEHLMFNGSENFQGEWFLPLVESDRMGHFLGAVTQESLDEQRAVVQNEKRQGDNRPYGKSSYAQLEGMFPEGHPYRWDTIGSLDDLNAASLDDVLTRLPKHVFPSLGIRLLLVRQMRSIWILLPIFWQVVKIVVYINV